MDKNEEIAYLKGIEANTFNTTTYVKDASIMCTKMTHNFSSLNNIFKGNLGFNKLTSNLSSIFTNMGKNISGSLKGIKTGLGNTFSGIASKLKNPFIGIKNKFGSIGTAAKNKINTVKDKVKNFFTPNLEKLQTKFYKKFLNVKNLAKEWATALNKASKQSISNTNSGAVFDTLIKEIKSIGKVVKSIGTVLNFFIATFWIGLTITLFVVLVPVVALLVAGLIIIMFILCSMLETLLQPLFNAISNAIEGFLSLITKPLNSIENLVSSIFDSISGIITTVATQLQDFISTVGPIFTNVVVDILQHVKTTMDLIDVGLQNTFKVLDEVFSWLSNKFGSSILSGIASGFGALANKMTNTDTINATNTNEQKINKNSIIPETFFTDYEQWRLDVSTLLTGFNSGLNNIMNSLFDTITPIKNIDDAFEKYISNNSNTDTILNNGFTLFNTWTKNFEAKFDDFAKTINTNIAKLTENNTEDNETLTNKFSLFTKLASATLLQTQLLNSINESLIAIRLSTVKITNVKSNNLNTASISDNKSINSLPTMPISKELTYNQFEPIINKMNELGEKLDNIITNTGLNDNGSMKEGAAWSI